MRGRVFSFSRYVLIGILLAATAPQALPALGALSPFDGPAGCEIDRSLFLTTPYMTGNDVEELQTYLRERGFYDGAVDGIFGPKTDAAVKAFQQAVGLPVDGVFRTEHWPHFWPDEPEPQPAATTPPPEGELHIVVDTRTLRLTVYVDGEPFKSYPVAVGRPTRHTLSPVGEWKIISKGKWGGGFGTRWMGLNVPWGTYGIHGTNKPGSIGTRASAGCIRMYNRDVEELYEWVSVGTPVKIVGVKPPITFGRRLNVGAVGKDVVEVQLRLKEMGFDLGDADGRFGPATRAAVERLQRTFGLPVDGEVWGDVYYILGLK